MSTVVHIAHKCYEHCEDNTANCTDCGFFVAPDIAPDIADVVATVVVCRCCYVTVLVNGLGFLELMLQVEDWKCTQCTRAKGTIKINSKERQ